jgi:hypothetical protein
MGEVQAIREGTSDNGDTKTDIPTETQYVGVLSAHSAMQELAVLTKGVPLFWSKDGEAIYFRRETGALARLDLHNKRADVIAGFDKNPVLGRLPGTDAVFVVRNNRIILVGLDGADVSQNLKDFAASIPFRDSDGRYLGSIEGAGAHQLFLEYNASATNPDSGHKQLVNFP